MIIIVKGYLLSDKDYILCLRNQHLDMTELNMSFRFLHVYCLVLLICQSHTHYTVSAHDVSIFDRFSVRIVGCIQLDVFRSNL
jgi:hypothetical protein